MVTLPQRKAVPDSLLSLFTIAGREDRRTSGQTVRRPFPPEVLEPYLSVVAPLVLWSSFDELALVCTC